MDKLLILTGGSSGIGKATLQVFLHQGWKAINLSRTACDLPTVTNITVNLLEPTWQTICLPTLTAACLQASQVCLVNNAAYYISDTIQTLQQDELIHSLMLNTVVPAQLSHALIPHLPKNSAIIHIGSTLSEKAVSHNLSYTTSKHAIVGLMRATCQDLVGTDIHTCCICPGITDTKMLQARCRGHDEILTMLKNLSCMGRLIHPAEIGELIYFCANHPLLNGAVIHANLGQVER